MPRNEATFSRPRSMASLPTQVCIWVEACLVPCRTKAANLSSEQNPAGKRAVPGECAQARPGGSCAQLLGLLAREVPGSIHRAGQAVASVCENQTWGDYKPTRAPQPGVPHASQRAVSYGAGRFTENLLNVFTLLSLPSHCQSGC